MMQLISDEQALVMKRAVMISYLQMKMNEEDWHGVMDASADLREIDVVLSYMKKSNLRMEPTITATGAYHSGSNQAEQYNPILNKRSQL